MTGILLSPRTVPRAAGIEDTTPVFLSICCDRLLLLDLLDDDRFNGSLSSSSSGDGGGVTGLHLLEVMYIASMAERFFRIRNAFGIFSSEKLKVRDEVSQRTMHTRPVKE